MDPCSMDPSFGPGPRITSVDQGPWTTSVDLVHEPLLLFCFLCFFAENCVPKHVNEIVNLRIDYYTVHHTFIPFIIYHK